MALEKRSINQYHPNGKLKYKQGIAVISECDKHLYDNVLQNHIGEYYIKYGETSKHYDNGVQAFVLYYDDKGKLIKDLDSLQKRSDGSNIQY